MEFSSNLLLAFYQVAVVIKRLVVGCELQVRFPLSFLEKSAASLSEMPPRGDPGSKIQAGPYVDILVNEFHN
jgi:hypothetical protein